MSLLACMYIATVRVTLRPSILDPQGKAIANALHDLGYAAVQNARVGKIVTLELDAPDADAAHTLATEAAEKLLANPVMEDFTVTVSAVEPA
ncbi:MAG: phosphoribosylformylglycinamidine synthase subunit PurS [Bacteroidota bacterium]